jgi:hypothetical protein
MAHLVGRLTGLKVAKVKTPGMYADGAGLYLQISGDGESSLAKSWIFRFTLRGRFREMGLGSLSLFGLAEARAKAAECRRQTFDAEDLCRAGDRPACGPKHRHRTREENHRALVGEEAGNGL